MDRLQVPSSEQSRLIGAVARLLSAEGHAVEQFETHLSWILVAGGLAYKFKKAVHLDFVDYSTLEARRFYCSEELRLNRRFSPRLYIDVVAISIEHGDACIGGTGPALDYALRMRAFNQDDLWSRRVRAARLCVNEIDQLAGCSPKSIPPQRRRRRQATGVRWKRSRQRRMKRFAVWPGCAANCAIVPC
jgi:hypothetical protein